MMTVDRRLKLMHGVSEDREMSLDAMLASIQPDDRATVEVEFRKLIGGAEEDTRVQFRVIRIEDGIERTLLANGRAMRDALGTPTRLIGATRDVSDRVAGDARRKLLNQELAHRLKNTLAIVSSIVAQTLRSAPDVTTARKSLTARIQALSKARDILLTGQRDAANIANIVATAVALHDEGRRVTLSSPALPTGPKASLTLSLIVHELATNAGKYGALSVPDGLVEVTWQATRDDGSDRPVLTFDWRELGGPPVSAPTRKGFGTRLVEMGLSGSVGGSSTIDYAPDGLRCRIVAPLVETMTEDETETDG